VALGWWRGYRATSVAPQLKKQYKVRPLELLRVHHEKIEAWILERAGIVFAAKAAPSALKLMA